ncbi:MAG: flagellar motor protein MotB [Terracidiphilus sp.]|jgi:outer membrane protein OmpA-like peptidoglycan-associated protein
MKTFISLHNSLPSQLALVLLASAIAIPASAQQGQSPAGSQSTSSASTQQQSSPTTSQTPSVTTPKEGFWGRVNPFARKKWVNNRVEPLKGQLNELDEVNAKNSRDIQDVDRRSQAGIRQAQSTADAANQAATAAGNQAQQASATAQGAGTHVDKLNSTVSGLDQYRQASEVEVKFRGGQPILSVAARKQLDDFAASLTGHQGYILEIEGHSPLASTAGIQNSGRMAEAVKRYLVTEHQIPVYRLHTVALGNAPIANPDANAAGNDAEAQPMKVKASSVHIRLMENSLAAREASSPHDVASSTGAERP